MMQQTLIYDNGILKKYCRICKQYKILNLFFNNNKNKAHGKSTYCFCIDHNHKTGKIRGLLCCRCNLALGNVNENVTILLNMVNYLRRNNK